MANLTATARRAKARQAAREVLADGVLAQDLTLRMVADRGGMPLPTLTYAYGAVGQLFDDLQLEFAAAVAESQSHVGQGGFRLELGRLIHDYLDILAADPANIEVLRWQMLQIAEGEIVQAAGFSMLPCLRRILERSDEQWALPLTELSIVTQAMISGMHVQFYVRGADLVALKAWRDDAALIVNQLTALARPVPAMSHP